MLRPSRKRSKATKARNRNSFPSRSTRFLRGATIASLAPLRDVPVCTKELDLLFSAAGAGALLFFPSRPSFFPRRAGGVVRRPRYGRLWDIAVDAKILDIS